LIGYSTADVRGANAEHVEQVRASVRGLFRRLNPSTSPTDLGTAAVYDWEVAADTGLSLLTIRACLQHLGGEAAAVELYGADDRVTGLLGQ
jgi:hypothetical protein